MSDSNVPTFNLRDRNRVKGGVIPRLLRKYVFSKGELSDSERRYVESRIQHNRLAREQYERMKSTKHE
jgi:hypothetical protein